MIKQGGRGRIPPAAGTRLGIGNDPRYNNPRCFDAFPFPAPSADVRDAIAARGEAIDAHRKAALARDARVTVTGLYNVVDKLDAGEPLSAAEQAVYTLGACGVLRDLHAELDRLVAEAYGWPWPMPTPEILDRLVALHDARVVEEAQGLVRWLRPGFQAPGAAVEAPAAELDLGGEEAEATTAAEPAPWPGEAIEQIAALKRLVAARATTVDEAARQFRGARRDLVARHLETLAILGEVRTTEGERYAAPAAF